MGYYSTLSFDGSVEEFDKEKLKQLNEKLEKEDWDGFSEMQITIENGLFDIESVDYHRKFYRDKEFAEELAKVIKKGRVNLKFTGEDGEVWGYAIINGKVYPTVQIMIPAQITDKVHKLIKNFFKERENGDGKVQNL